MVAGEGPARALRVDLPVCQPRRVAPAPVRRGPTYLRPCVATVPGVGWHSPSGHDVRCQPRLPEIDGSRQGAIVTEDCKMAMTDRDSGVYNDGIYFAELSN